ncbi:unnamed protein product [Symbiodinium natans]|uniref:Uncharacterized protein n=1 Tax=Symbiodinium natans TaxID=878477 RepID=A0A812Q1Y8_9DINO|nr:unnamed protein product [Symbiodinium natans]
MQTPRWARARCRNGIKVSLQRLEVGDKEVFDARHGSSGDCNLFAPLGSVCLEGMEFFSSLLKASSPRRLVSSTRCSTLKTQNQYTAQPTLQERGLVNACAFARQVAIFVLGKTGLTDGACLIYFMLCAVSSKRMTS